MRRITLQGFIDVPPHELKQIEEALPLHITLTLQEPGCLEFVVKQDPVNPCRFHVYEAFIDQAAFDLHQQRVKRSRWGELTVNVERHYRIHSAAEADSDL